MRQPRLARANLAFAGIVGSIVGVSLLTGCQPDFSGPAASTLPDGQYTGQSATEEDGSYGVVNFTVSSGTVTDADFVVYDADGTPHDEDYGLGSDGKAVDEAFYQRAQNAIAAEQEFVTAFEETSDQNEVESIAGASLSYRLFRDAIAEAIGDAQA